MVPGNKDLEMDLQNLISCIECHKEENKADVIIETLKTIVNICTEDETGKDAFREVGGLNFLLQFIINTDQVFILEYGLKVLAFVIDGNVHSQMHLTDDKVFRILQAIFKKETYPLSVLKNAIVLFSTLLFQNRSAQDIIQQNKSLQSLMTLYQCFAPIHACCSSSTEDRERLEVWLATNSALCFAVNNPLHEKNQVICSALFPMTLKIIEADSNPTIIEAVSSFLSLSIANNEKNQDEFAELDGFPILKHSLSRNFEEIQSCIKEYNNIIRKGTLQILNSLISIIGATVSDHEKNASLCGKLGVITQMVKLLSTVALNTYSIKKILLVLGHCVDACCENRFIILEAPKLDVLLKKNLEIDDPELHSAARYLLQVCLNDINEENEPDKDFCSEPADKFLKSCQHRFEVLAGLTNSIFKENISYQMNHNDSFSGLLGIHDHILSQESSKKLNAAKLKTKSFKKPTEQDHQAHKYIKKKNFENDNQGSDSLEEISLHSAGHLNWVCNQVNVEGTDRSLHKFIQKSKLTNHAIDKECHSNSLEANISDIGNIKTDCKKSKLESCKKAQDKLQQNSKKLIYSRQRMSKLKNEIKKDKKRALSNLDSSLSSSLLKIGKSKQNNWSKNTERSSSSEEVSRTVSPSPDLYKSAAVSRENVEVHSPNIENQERTERKISSSSSQKRPSKMPGCMEVIVLPGVTCNKHKLASHFELLKVCPLPSSK